MELCPFHFKRIGFFFHAIPLMWMNELNLMYFYPIRFKRSLSVLPFPGPIDIVP